MHAIKVRPKGRTLALLAVASLLGAGGTLTDATAAAAAARYAGTGTAKTGGTALNMRRAPSSGAAWAGSVVNGGTVWLMCQTGGDRITGTVRTTMVWDRLANNTYVSDAYVSRAAYAIPKCVPATPPPVNNAVGPIPVVRAPLPPSARGWQLPVVAGVVSGFRPADRPTHDGVDLGAVRYTPIRAVAAGKVVTVTCNVSTGNCDVDGNRSLSGCGWYVEVAHANKIVTRYCHMIRRPAVTVGQTVAKGQILGYVGMSGSASGPHLHFEVHVNAPPATHANAVSPIAFMKSHGLTIK